MKRARFLVLVLGAGIAAAADPAPATGADAATGATGAAPAADASATAAWAAAGTSTGAAIQPGDTVVRMTAQRFRYDPDTVTVKVGQPLVFELLALDRRHGFSLPDFGQRADLLPGVITRLRIVPTHPGSFTFACDIFCGSGHDDMSGTLVVTP